ncbi:MAG: NAD-dependent deacylase [Candidatus Thalassarchaeaceae archaeon]|nr:NAD-dependent deacylase [Candidatus Thalassarchaeaceae archaeon]
MALADVIPSNRPLRVAVLTGAGISAESGVNTFRGQDGLWNGHRIEDVATPEGWIIDSEKVWAFYQERRRQLKDVEPNSGHLALSELEKRMEAGCFTLITQNVDDLHERGGTENLIHMHGELRLLRCEVCEHKFEAMDSKHLENDEFIPCPECGNPKVRPEIVWFGEMPFQMNELHQAVIDCDLFLVIGTSGNVYPAAGLLGQALSSGSYCVGINLEPPLNVDLFDEFHQGSAGELLPLFVKELIDIML